MTFLVVDFKIDTFSVQKNMTSYFPVYSRCTTIWSLCVNFISLLLNLCKELFKMRKSFFFHFQRVHSFVDCIYMLDQNILLEEACEGVASSHGKQEKKCYMFFKGIFPEIHCLHQGPASNFLIFLKIVPNIHFWAGVTHSNQNHHHKRISCFVYL